MASFFNKLSHGISIIKVRGRIDCILLFIVILALGLRFIMPVYLLLAKEQNPLRFMLGSMPRFSWNIIERLARKEMPLEDMPVAYEEISAHLIRWTNPMNDKVKSISAIQIMQGIIDSIGCLLIYGILGLYFSRRISRLGGLLYAIWPPSIFFSYHILPEAYTPVLVLAIGYMTLLAIKSEKTFWCALAGLFCSVLLCLRMDNALILLFIAVYLLFIFRKKKIQAIAKVLLIVMAAIIPLLLINGTIRETYKFKHSRFNLSISLYNALAEYPGTYKGVRFYEDLYSEEYIKEKALHYKQTEDSTFRFLSSLYPKDPGIAVYVREVIIGNPILYSDWLARRFLAYLPSHPYVACIVYFYSKPKAESGWETMLGYRYSGLFQGVKYFDYLLFFLFLLGVWHCRSNRAMMAFLFIYLGVHIGHVLSQCGEIYFKLDKEYALLIPKYLVGMVSIWPVFIAIELDRIVERMRCEFSRLFSRKNLSA